MAESLTWREAIERVLAEEGRAMHIQQIWDRIQKRGYYSTKGETPQNTISTMITTSINQDGPRSPFVRVEPGVYAMRSVTGRRGQLTNALRDDHPDSEENSEDLKLKDDESDHPDDEASAEVQSSIPSYGIDDIIADGCFLDPKSLEKILRRLHEKKNLILQGPPGTGKTWLAKRLGMALIGCRVQEPQLRVVQFHPNLSYEDFVRGWRPNGDGSLALHDGVFMQMVNAALHTPSRSHVLVIEEINRGNPAQIFGELLTLLEAGKRTPLDAMQICYPGPDGVHRPVYVPHNLYVIGTMNIADRSLALVDMAFRRRFAFFDLDPALGETWRNWVVEHREMEVDIALAIEQRINQLNKQIASDSRLGTAFQIGHSYVTPTEPLGRANCRSWFAEVVASELKPLLREYWFDAPEEAERAVAELLQGW